MIIWNKNKSSNFLLQRYFWVSKKFYNKIFRPTRTELLTFPQRTWLLSLKRSNLNVQLLDRLEFGFFLITKNDFLDLGTERQKQGEAHWTERNSSSRSQARCRGAARFKCFKSAPLKSLLQMPNDRKRPSQIRKKLINLKILNNKKKKNDNIMLKNFRPPDRSLHPGLPRSDLPRWRVAARLHQFQTSQEWREEWWCTLTAPSATTARLGNRSYGSGIFCGIWKFWKKHFSEYMSWRRVKLKEIFY